MVGGEEGDEGELEAEVGEVGVQFAAELGGVQEDEKGVRPEVRQRATKRSSRWITSDGDQAQRFSSSATSRGDGDQGGKGEENEEEEILGSIKTFRFCPN